MRKHQVVVRPRATNQYGYFKLRLRSTRRKVIVQIAFFSLDGDKTTQWYDARLVDLEVIYDDSNGVVQEGRGDE